MAISYTDYKYALKKACGIHGIAIDSGVRYNNEWGAGARRTAAALVKSLENRASDGSLDGKLKKLLKGYLPVRYKTLYPQVVIAAGHTKGWNVSSLLDVGSEGAEVIVLANELADELERRGVDVLYVPDALDLQAEIDWAIRSAKKGSLAVELHTNGPGGRGFSCIYSPWSTKSLRCASRIRNAVRASGVMPLKGNGLLSSGLVASWNRFKSGDIGWTRALRAAGFVPVMPECGFHTSVADARVLNNRKLRARLISAIADGIAPKK